MSHLQGTGLGTGVIGITPTLPYVSSEKTGKIKSIDSRDFWKILSMTSMEVCECGSGWQSLFVAQKTYSTPTP